MRYCILQYFCSRAVSSSAFVCVQIGCVRSHSLLNKLLLKSQAWIIRMSHRIDSRIWRLSRRFVLFPYFDECISVIVVEQDGQTFWQCWWLTSFEMKGHASSWINSGPAKRLQLEEWVCMYELYQVPQWAVPNFHVISEGWSNDTLPWRALVKFG